MLSSREGPDDPVRPLADHRHSECLIEGAATRKTSGQLMLRANWVAAERYERE